MKTIEERAREYARKAQSLIMDSIEEEELYKNDLIRVYVAGAKEATRWISVEDELPEVHVNVIVKTKKGSNAICSMYTPIDGYGTILGPKEWRGSGTFKDSITHWRPIELKIE